MKIFNDNVRIKRRKFKKVTYGIFLLILVMIFILSLSNNIVNSYEFKESLIDNNFDNGMNFLEIKNSEFKIQNNEENNNNSFRKKRMRTNNMADGKKNTTKGNGTELPGILGNFSYNNTINHNIESLLNNTFVKKSKIPIKLRIFRNLKARLWANSGSRIKRNFLIIL